jgi:hypothetical protein
MTLVPQHGFWLGVSAAMAGALLLAAAGAGHLRGRDAFRHVLQAHRLLPAGSQRLVARLLPVSEVVIGSAVLVSIPFGVERAAPALAAQSVLYAGFAGYTTMLWRRGSTAPCGCFSGGEAAGPVIIGRAALFSVSALASALVSVARGPFAASGEWLPVLWITAVAVAAAAWFLPAVMAAAPTTTKRGYP